MKTWIRGPALMLALMLGKCEQRHIAVSDSGAVGDKKPPVKK